MSVQAGVILSVSDHTNNSHPKNRSSRFFYRVFADATNYFLLSQTGHRTTIKMVQSSVYATLVAAAATGAFAAPDPVVTLQPANIIPPVVGPPPLLATRPLVYPVRTVTIPAADYFPTHVERHPPVTATNCPVGYSQLFDKCVKTIHRQPDVVCPVGFSLSVGRNVDTADDQNFGQCVKTVAKESECAPTFFRTDTGICRRRIEAAPLRICPEGFAQTADGSVCKRILDVPPKRLCPVGFRENTNGDCIQSIREVVELGCDEGALDGSKCRVEVTYDCTEQFHRAVRTGFKNSVGTYGPTRLLVRRPEIPEVVAKTCRKVTYTEPRRTCPLGFSIVGDECVREITTDKIWGLPGVEEQVTDFIITCPSGFEKFENAGFYRCFGIEESALVYSCPSGAFDNGDVCLYFADQEYACPDDYVLDVPPPSLPEAEAALPICSKALLAPLQHVVEYGYTCTGTDCPLSPLNDSPLGPPIVPL